MLVACSGDSGPPSVSSFHYVETATGNIDGDPVDSREEGSYTAPDSARIVGNDRSAAIGLENIVIGPRGWRRDESGWSTDDYCYNALSVVRRILAYGGNHDDSVDGVDGPTMGGEPTRLYKATSEDAGGFILSYEERTLGDSPEAQEILGREREIFSNLTETTELTIGKNTGRVYSLVFSRDGPKMSDRRETVVDQYDEPVDIKPPPDVPPSTEDQRSRASCPESLGDFPRIPVAIAAVLGPLLFLAGSAFLWPGVYNRLIYRRRW